MDSDICDYVSGTCKIKESFDFFFQKNSDFGEHSDCRLLSKCPVPTGQVSCSTWRRALWPVSEAAQPVWCKVGTVCLLFAWAHKTKPSVFEILNYYRYLQTLLRREIRQRFFFFFAIDVNGLFGMRNYFRAMGLPKEGHFNGLNITVLETVAKRMTQDSVW